MIIQGTYNAEQVPECLVGGGGEAIKEEEWFQKKKVVEEFKNSE